MKMRTLFGTLWALFFVAGLPVSADGSLTLITYTDYAPYVSDEVPEGGMLTAIVRAALAHQGVKLEVTYIPWKRAYRMVKDGEAIGTFSWQKTEERKRDFILSDTMFGDTDYIHTTLPDFREMADLTKRHDRGEQSVICLPLGWTVPARFKAFIAKGVVKRVTPEKMESCLDLMHGGRAQILNVPSLVIHYQLKVLAQKLGLKGRPLPDLVTINPDAQPVVTTHVLFARTAEGIAAAAIFEKGLRGILANGTYLAIIGRHLRYYSGIDRAQIYTDLRQVGIDSGAP